MKFSINYDLLEKINTANGNMNIKRMMLGNIKKSVCFSGIYTALGIFIGIKPWTLYFFANSGFFVGSFSMDLLLEKIFKDKIEKKACIELTNLLVQLRDNLKINTSLELLKEAELTKVEYKHIRNKLKPQQNKYILVPAYDGIENIRNVSILQEHVIDTKKYILSVGSPIKVLELKPAFNH